MHFSPSKNEKKIFFPFSSLNIGIFPTFGWFSFSTRKKKSNRGKTQIHLYLCMSVKVQLDLRNNVRPKIPSDTLNLTLHYIPILFFPIFSFFFFQMDALLFGKNYFSVVS